MRLQLLVHVHVYYMNMVFEKKIKPYMFYQVIMNILKKIFCQQTIYMFNLKKMMRIWFE